MVLSCYTSNKTVFATDTHRQMLNKCKKTISYVPGEMRQVIHFSGNVSLPDIPGYAEKNSSLANRL
jgi:hypothetical protein